jgi:hypothetical protein
MTAAAHELGATALERRAKGPAALGLTRNVKTPVVLAGGRTVEKVQRVGGVR